MALKARPKLPLAEKLRMTFGRRTLVMLVTASFLTLTAWALFETVIGLWAYNVFKYGPAQIGYLLTLMGVISVIVQGGAMGALTRRFGERALARAAVALLIIGYIAISMVGQETPLWLACTVLALGSALFNPSLSSMVSFEAGEHERGAVLGVYQGATALGRVVGPAVSGLVFARLGQPAPFILAALLVAPALLLLLLLRPSPVAKKT